MSEENVSTVIPVPVVLSVPNEVPVPKVIVGLEIVSELVPLIVCVVPLPKVRLPPVCSAWILTVPVAPASRVRLPFIFSANAPAARMRISGELPPDCVREPLLPVTVKEALVPTLLISILPPVNEELMVPLCVREEVLIKILPPLPPALIEEPTGTTMLAPLAVTSKLADPAVVVTEPMVKTVLLPGSTSSEAPVALTLPVSWPLPCTQMDLPTWLKVILPSVPALDDAEILPVKSIR